MKLNKTKIAFAEAHQHHRQALIEALNQLQDFEISTKAVNGRDLILQLHRNPKKQPAIILLDMQMLCCDSITTTMICKELFPNSKIVGLSSQIDTTLIGEFYAEGGHTILSKKILYDFTFAENKNESNINIFQKTLNHILISDDRFMDSVLHENTEFTRTFIKTKDIIEKNHKELSKNEIFYLRLTAAGFNREEKAELMCKSESTIQKYFNKLSNYFNVDNRADLITAAICFGIVKFVRIYQPPHLLDLL
jgi:DNA-binding NarL/FixJ family response regulator